MEAAQIPEEITVSAQTFEVNRVKDLRDDDGNKANGTVQCDEQIICLCTSIRNHDTIRFVMLHELAHVIEDHAGLSLKETQIDSIARDVFSLIRDNPDLVRWIQEPKPARRPRAQTPPPEIIDGKANDPT